jgi:hypothetical protein
MMVTNQAKEGLEYEGKVLKVVKRIQMAQSA